MRETIFQIYLVVMGALIGYAIAVTLGWCQ